MAGISKYVVDFVTVSILFSINFFLYIVYDTNCIRYRKIPTLEGLIYRLREICVSKSIVLAYSWEAIYVRNLQKVFSEDVDIFRTHPCKYFVYMERGNPSQE